MNVWPIEETIVFVRDSFIGVLVAESSCNLLIWRGVSYH